MDTSLENVTRDASSIPELVQKSQLRHIAFIMDGNRRYAKAHGLPKEAGHRAGAEVFRNIVEYCGEIGISVMTVYALSTENLKNRSKMELDALMKLFGEYFEDAITSIKSKDLTVRFLGDRTPLPASVQEMMERLEKKPGREDQILQIALNYGARDEIVRAVNRLMAEGKTSVTEDELNAALDTGSVPPPDLIVRTGAESRLSNFLLWQAAYAELYYSDVLWPDFRPGNVDEAVSWFAGRNRRRGV